MTSEYNNTALDLTATQSAIDWWDTPVHLHNNPQQTIVLNAKKETLANERVGTL